MPTSYLKDLVRNPLGIVALFISLIYGLASLLLAWNATALSPEERAPLIAFVTLFPIVVLGVFYLLVTRHHKKLYAPSDFKSDESFLSTLSNEEVEAKRKSEAYEALHGTEEPSLGPANYQPDTTAPSAEASQGAPTEMPVKAKDAASRTPSFNKFLNDVRRAEVGVIAKLEKEFGQLLIRHVEISKSGISFDAFLPGGTKSTFAEVKLVSRPVISPSTLDGVLYRALLADATLNRHFKLILVVVYSFAKTDLPQMESLWRQKVERCPAEIELRFMPLDELDT